MFGSEQAFGELSIGDGEFFPAYSDDASHHYGGPAGGDDFLGILDDVSAEADFAMMDTHSAFPGDFGTGYPMQPPVPMGGMPQYHQQSMMPPMSHMPPPMAPPQHQHAAVPGAATVAAASASQAKRRGRPPKAKPAAAPVSIAPQPMMPQHGRQMHPHSHMQHHMQHQPMAPPPQHHTQMHQMQQPKMQQHQMMHQQHQAHMAPPPQQSIPRAPAQSPAGASSRSPPAASPVAAAATAPAELGPDGKPKPKPRRRQKLTPEEREARKKQRLVQRRLRKSAREKERRSLENEYFDELANLVGLPPDQRDKATVLEAVIDAIREENPEMSQEEMDRNLSNLYKLFGGPNGKGGDASRNSTPSPDNASPSDDYALPMSPPQHGQSMPPPSSALVKQEPMGPPLSRAPPVPF